MSLRSGFRLCLFGEESLGLVAAPKDKVERPPFGDFHSQSLIRRGFEMRRSHWWFLLILIAVTGTPLVAEAHALLVSSSPKDKAVLKAAPKQVVLRFDARIEKALAAVTLRLGREAIELPKPAHGYTGGKADELIIPMPALKPGSYRLEYRVMASDGHLTPGLIRFKISEGKKP